VAGLVVMDIAPVTYTITDGTNWQDTQKVKSSQLAARTDEAPSAILPHLCTSPIRSS
jgi:hypothetical protein